MSLDPVIFDSPAEFVEAVERAVTVLRRADAARFRVLADDYELQALKETDVSEREKLAGIAGGLLIAAALVENQAEVPA